MRVRPRIPQPAGAGRKGPERGLPIPGHCIKIQYVRSRRNAVPCSAAHPRSPVRSRSASVSHPPQPRAAPCRRTRRGGRRDRRPAAGDRRRGLGQDQCAGAPRGASRRPRRRSRCDPAADHLAGAKLAWAGTFHSVGARLLRDYAPRIGLNPAFTIHDREDAADLLNLLRHELGLADTAKRFPRKNTCLAIYSAVVNTLAPLGEMLQRRYPWCLEWEDELKRLFRAYVEAKQAQYVLDYDDLLLYWAQMAAEPALASEIGARFAHVLVDEYQDTNALQASIVRALRPDGSGVTVVGDDAQSIYAFRGATVRNILDFPAQFTPPARVVTLARNYRSTQPILAAANGVIARAAEGYAKSLWSERASAERPWCGPRGTLTSRRL